MFLLCVSSKGFDETDPEVIKTFFMLNSAEHKIYPAHKCWHFNIY